VRLPVLSRRVPVSVCCRMSSFTAGIRFADVIASAFPNEFSNTV
jgi:hypothetical protein